MSNGDHAAARSAAIPRTVWALGVVSLLMDMSSEVIHALLPLFLTTTLGASVAMVGLIDGIAEATAAVVKVWSGWLSDMSGRRKPLILLGYGLGALSKPLFPLAHGPMLVLGARFVDRVGKGLRGAPRDALIADVTPLAQRGRAYGLRQALDTTGAFLGPLAAIGLLALCDDDLRAVFWYATVPAVACVLWALIGVHETPRAHDAPARVPIRLADLRELGPGYWRVVGLATVFTLARFSEAFLILEAQARGLPLTYAPLVLVAMNVVYAAGAYPAGVLADRAGAHGLLYGGLAALLAADLALACATDLMMVFAGIALWGLHMALTQGLMSTLVAEQAPPALRASAFGLYNLFGGAALLAASVVAGLLWDAHGARATFLVGAGFTLLTAVLLTFRPAPAVR